MSKAKWIWSTNWQWFIFHIHSLWSIQISGCWGSVLLTPFSCSTIFSPFLTISLWVLSLFNICGLCSLPDGLGDVLIFTAVWKTSECYKVWHWGLSLLLPSSVNMGCLFECCPCFLFLFFLYLTHGCFLCSSHEQPNVPSMKFVLATNQSFVIQNPMFRVSSYQVWLHLL